MTMSEEKFERKGDCNQCGWCCQYLGVHRGHARAQVEGAQVDPDTARFLELRGGKKTPDGKAVRYLMWGYMPCAHHDDEKQCTIYEDRPQVCADYPNHPEQIEGSPCSYWFESVVDGQLVQRGGQASPYPTEPVFDD